MMRAREGPDEAGDGVGVAGADGGTAQGGLLTTLSIGMATHLALA